VKIYNRYILIIAVLLLVTTVILTAAGQNTLDLYYTIYITEALVVTELYVHFNAKARHGLTMVSLILFGGFLVVVSLQVVRLLVFQ
jgi:hypothetical protein